MRLINEVLRTRTRQSVARRRKIGARHHGNQVHFIRIAARMTDRRPSGHKSRISGSCRDGSAGRVLKYIFHQDRVVPAQKTLPNPVSRCCRGKSIHKQPTTSRRTESQPIGFRSFVFHADRKQSGIIRDDGSGTNPIGRGAYQTIIIRIPKSCHPDRVLLSKIPSMRPNW